MKPTTKQRRIDQLIEEIRLHPNKDELLMLMDSQVADDKCTNVSSLKVTLY